MTPSSWHFPLFKRFPKLRLPLHIDQELIPRDVQEEYQKIDPDFAKDFVVLEETLMQDFRDCDHYAARAQNQFHRQQVILILGSILVTTLGAVQVTLAALTHTSLGAGLAEAVVAAILAGVAQFTQASRAQQRYFGSRLKAETLRAEYFLFLGHLHPYDDQKRQDRLRKRLAAIKASHQSQQMALTGTANNDVSHRRVRGVSKREEYFWRLYYRYRYMNQLRFYQERQEEFEQAQVQATILTTALMTLASVVSLFGSVDLFRFSIGWATLAVLFPALVAALSIYASVYAFERHATLYTDASLALEAVGMPSMPETATEATLQDYVGAVEHICQAEQGQWGQLVSQIKGAPSPGINSSAGGGGT